MTIKGNIIHITIYNGGDTHIVLPDGYSYERIHIITLTNIWGISENNINNNYIVNFPPINSKSPNYFDFNITDNTKPAAAKIIIEKFGQIPDPHYFDKAFDPILVVGDDGNEYNVIPSDQFK